MPEPPSGTVTLLFTDIEGSTRLLQRAGDDYADLLAEHRRLLRNAFENHGGYEVDTEGDAFFVAFSSVKEAVAAAAEAQQALARHQWPTDIEIRVRMGVHTGEPRLIERNYVGLDVHQTARVMAAGHGGQVLVSQSTRDLLHDRFNLRDLGEHRLKDLSGPQRLYQLQIEGLVAEFPPLETLENRPTNLPVQPTPLIGREKELKEVEVLLCRDDVRLLTLTGPGGTGKTRLALQAGADLVEEFPNGVFFVSLAPISDGELIVPTIAQTLALREQGATPLIETLCEYLHEKRLLLLLDNFEQIVQAAPSIATLRAAAPMLTVLVTSRTPLHLSGEQTYEVPPLALPDPRRLPPLELLAQYEAVALFTERARAAKSDFAVTKTNALAIAEICVRLDGLPLALELAAARVRALPPQTLLSRLDQRLKLLTGGSQDLEERQRTLRATIDWSYDLLSESEKKLFGRLGVFVDGCRLDAAEAICEHETNDEDVVDGLSSLVEHNLLRQKEDANGEPRYWMLETIREFAQERFGERSDAETVRRRHAEYFQRLSEEAAAQLEGGEQQSAWMMRLEDEHSNLRAALTFWRCEPDSQLAMALAVEPFWRVRGHWREGRRWLEEVLAAGDRSSPQCLKALEMAQYYAYLLRDTERARALLEELLPLARDSENRPIIAMALWGQSILALAESDRERAETLAEESLEFCEGEHDSIHPLSGLGFLAFFRDDYEGARTFFYRSLAVGRAFSDDYEVASDLAILATIVAFEGDEQEALALLREGVALAQKLDSRPALALRCVPALAALRSLQGDAEASVRLIGAAEALRQEMGSSVGTSLREFTRRILEVAQGELDEERIAEVFEEGRSLTLDEALADAPRNEPAPPSPHAGNDLEWLRPRTPPDAR